MAARCHDRLFKPGFPLDKVAANAADVGRLGADGEGNGLACMYCKALLYPGEAKNSRSGKRGRYCCAEGQVELPPAKRHALIDRLWRDEGADGALLRKYSRQFNNAFALACEMYDEVQQDGTGWAPSIVIQGKLYQQIGALRPQGDAQPGFAQLYVYDPAGENDEALKRAAYMRMDNSASRPEKERAVELLNTLQHTLRTSNAYVGDFVHAAQIFAAKDVADARFVIEAKSRRDERDRTYRGFQSFNEVSVMAVEPRDGGAPKRSVVVREREGGLHYIDETNRAFDPLHFVLLFPCGDDGWTTGLHKRPKGDPPTASGQLWDARTGKYEPNFNNRSSRAHACTRLCS